MKFSDLSNEDKLMWAKENLAKYGIEQILALFREEAFQRGRQYATEHPLDRLWGVSSEAEWRG